VQSTPADWDMSVILLLIHIYKFIALWRREWQGHDNRLQIGHTNWN